MEMKLIFKASRNDEENIFRCFLDDENGLDKPTKLSLSSDDVSCVCENLCKTFDFLSTFHFSLLS